MNLQQTAYIDNLLKNRRQLIKKEKRKIEDKTICNKTLLQRRLANESILISEISKELHNVKQR